VVGPDRRQNSATIVARVPIRSRQAHRGRLRIVPDFRSHSAALAFMPVLRNHNHRDFEIIAYSCSPLRDGVTEEFRSLVDGWVDAWHIIG